MAIYLVVAAIAALTDLRGKKEQAMSNIDPIRALYAAFAKGDMPAALATMAADIVWNEAGELSLRRPQSVCRPARRC